MDGDPPSKEATSPATKADQAAARKQLRLEKEHKQPCFLLGTVTIFQID
jgi:hypothetical protein